jgi:FkbM family methyltransferase
LKAAAVPEFWSRKMSFVSYAQNYEDVMLWRALGVIKDGFWIDVGAAHPTELSVTRAFYERGWHGINIEPEPEYAAALRTERLRDINLEVAIGAKSGSGVFSRVPGTGLSSLDHDIAARHEASGYPAVEPMTVRVMTLSEVCAAYGPRDIHFLKIDVEGTERDVLLGADLTKYRPWIIVIEATFPLSPDPTIEAFAELLAAANYRQCWFDGLNAFFVAMERADQFTPFFRVPPNLFDGFIRADQMAATRRAEAAEARVAELERALVRARLQDHPAKWIADLLPWNRKRERQQKAAA